MCTVKLQNAGMSVRVGGRRTHFQHCSGAHFNNWNSGFQMYVCKVNRVQTLHYRLVQWIYSFTKQCYIEHYNCCLAGSVVKAWALNIPQNRLLITFSLCTRAPVEKPRPSWSCDLILFCAWISLDLLPPSTSWNDDLSRECICKMQAKLMASLEATVVMFTYLYCKATSFIQHFSYTRQTQSVLHINIVIQ